MVKPEWGTKRTCPKCGTRFYDLGEEDPVTCINSECGAIWEPEPVLKSKQPVIFDDKKDEKDKKDDADLSGDDDEDEDLVADVDEDAEINPDDEVDLGGDDDIQVDTSASGDDKEDDS
ncbi:MAG: TIGR02300 family protein [Parasphingopyxis sp.]|uniref:TIGR02300 family protein n=1 Tax=Parasphingopyxis sp. TaxID=1920299 RepID=UPI003FA09DDD